MDNHEKHVKKVLWQLKKVFWQLKKHGLFCNPRKCKFHMSECKFLSYILSPDSFQMAEDKNIKWNWGLEAQKAFVDLKEAFTQAPVLTHWEPDQLITIKTDASDYAVAAILSITLSNSELHPVVFLSRTLMGAELNYDTHDKELLAIFEVFKTWHHYLEGALNPIDIVTNHKNLKYFSTTKILTRRQPGRLGAKPDALTRCWDVYPKEGDTSYISSPPFRQPT
ncbi:reverse transcriptase [Moniliophthora roreri MCA 2997]|uniref:Reverse transcriptase n=1 Tax=Moniliophthora roreri (strain MCA 2997) TaxID=1381753 RepID=V2WML5_MONRO|nr:reverse transcriptase [Moniliophthora roreri MCA 2997]